LSLYSLYTMVLDPGFRNTFTHTNRWFLTCVNQPNFAKHIGQVELCKKMAVAPEPVKEEVAAPKEQPAKKEKQKQPQQPKPQAPPKEQEEEDPEDEEKGAKKEKNPLDSLPKSKLDLEEWKRVYSNTKNLDEAMAWFWDHYDSEGYCLYFCTYKYNSEITQMFKALNHLSGFMQRLEKLHKYAFGNLLIFGEEPTLEVSCCWLFRGTVIPPEMSGIDDFVLYEWTKADHSSETDRTKINEFWTWKGYFGGKLFQEQGKTFK